MLLTTNVLVALLCWFAFHWLGLDNAGAWAVAAGLLHIVPYLGPGVTAAVTGMAAFMQFDSFAMAGLVAGASLAIATAVGTFVTTWMTGRIARMNRRRCSFRCCSGDRCGESGHAPQHPHHGDPQVVAENVEPSHRSPNCSRVSAARTRRSCRLQYLDDFPASLSPLRRHRPSGRPGTHFTHRQRPAAEPGAPAPSLPLPRDGLQLAEADSSRQAAASATLRVGLNLVATARCT